MFGVMLIFPLYYVNLILMRVDEQVTEDPEVQ
jgi:hypothetical protein